MLFDYSFLYSVCFKWAKNLNFEKKYFTIKSSNSDTSRTKSKILAYDDACGVTDFLFLLKVKFRVKNDLVAV